MKLKNILVFILTIPFVLGCCLSRKSDPTESAKVTNYQCDYFSFEYPDGYYIAQESSTDSCFEVIIKKVSSDWYHLSIQASRKDIFGGNLDDFLGPVVSKEWEELDAAGETCNKGSYHGSSFTSGQGYECTTLWNWITSKGDTISKDRIFIHANNYMLLTESENQSERERSGEEYDHPLDVILGSLIQK